MPSLPFAFPWISAAATKPSKSPIVLSSPPFGGWNTWAAGFAATGLNEALNPPGIGFGPVASRLTARLRRGTLRRGPSGCNGAGTPQDEVASRDLAGADSSLVDRGRYHTGADSYNGFPGDSRRARG